MSTVATVLSRLASTSIGPLIWPVASACRFSSAIAFWTGSARTSSALIATCAGSLPPGKAASNFFIGSISGIEMSSSPVVVVFRENAGTVRATSTAPAATAETTGRRRTPLEDRAPEAALAVLALEPVQERDPALLDLVAEPAEQRREHRQRAEHRDRDDHHRPDREGHERLVAGEEHAGHRDQHGDAGDQDGAAGRGCGGLERGVLAASGGALFALAPEVEERVVDPDGEPDQQDHLGDRSSTGKNWLGSAIRLVVAMTAVIASSSGTSAATRSRRRTAGSRASAGARSSRPSRACC